MHVSTLGAIGRKKKHILMAIFLSMFFMAGPAKAVLIDFDDLTYVPSDPDFPCFCDTPVTNEYESLGLIIDGGFLLPYQDWNPNVVSAPNYLLGANSLRLSFVGALPTFVSMVVNAALEEAILFDVYGEDGLLGRHRTDGYAGPDESTPYTPNQLMTLTYAQGISYIVIEGYYHMRTSAAIDDLRFEYTSVPAPATLFLLGLGLLGLTLRKRADALQSST